MDQADALQQFFHMFNETTSESSLFFTASILCLFCAEHDTIIQSSHAAGSKGIEAQARSLAPSTKRRSQAF